MNVEILKDGCESGDDIAEAGKIAGRGFGENHASGVSAGACADQRGFQQYHAFVGRKSPQPGCGGQPGKAAAYDGELCFRGDGTLVRLEINGPRWIAPARVRTGRFMRLLLSGTG